MLLLYYITLILKYYTINTITKYITELLKNKFLHLSLPIYNVPLMKGLKHFGFVRFHFHCFIRS